MLIIANLRQNIEVSSPHWRVSWEMNTNINHPDEIDSGELLHPILYSSWNISIAPRITNCNNNIPGPGRFIHVEDSHQLIHRITSLAYTFTPSICQHDTTLKITAHAPKCSPYEILYYIICLSSLKMPDLSATYTHSFNISLKISNFQVNTSINKI